MKKATNGFTLSMAIMDTLPVLFFSMSAGILSARFESWLFLCGTILVILAGTMKVLWKLLLAIVHKDVTVLNRQMRYVMPAGFVSMMIALIKDHDQWSISAVFSHVFSFPSAIFFLLAMSGIFCMLFFSHHFDQTDAKANWIEQITNALTQFFFMIGILI